MFALGHKHKEVETLGEGRRLGWDGVLGELLGRLAKFCFLTRMVDTWVFAL